MAVAASESDEWPLARRDVRSEKGNRLAVFECTEDARRAWHREKQRTGIQVALRLRRQVTGSAPCGRRQEHRGAHADVQTLYETSHRYSHAPARCAAQPRADAAMLVAEDQR